MPLTIYDVRQIARLARLELGDDEASRQMRHINELMHQFETLSDLDVAGIEPTAHSIPLHSVFREDRTMPSIDRDEVLGQAPEARDGCFVVPRILEAQ